MDGTFCSPLAMYIVLLFRDWMMIAGYGTVLCFLSSTIMIRNVQYTLTYLVSI